MQEFDYQIVYDIYDDYDNMFAFQFAEYFEKEVQKWGFRGYIEDRDGLPGQSIFHELFRVADNTDKTIFLITRSDSNWVKFCREAIFKEKIDNANRHNCIAIALNIPRDDKLHEALRIMKVNGPVYFKGYSEREWTAEKASWNRIKLAFGVSEVTRLQDNQTVSEGVAEASSWCCGLLVKRSYVSTETSDTRVRTDVNDQIVTQPTSTMPPDLDEQSHVQNIMQDPTEVTPLLGGAERSRAQNANKLPNIVSPQQFGRISPESEDDDKDVEVDGEGTCKAATDPVPLATPQKRHNQIQEDTLVFL